VLSGGDWWCHNPNSTKGQFYSRARQPTILSKLELVNTWYFILLRVFKVFPYPAIGM